MSNTPAANYNIEKTLACVGCDDVSPEVSLDKMAEVLCAFALNNMEEDQEIAELNIEGICEGRRVAPDGTIYCGIGAVAVAYSSNGETLADLVFGPKDPPLNSN